METRRFHIYGIGRSQTVQTELTILQNQGSEQYQIEQTLAQDEQMQVDFGKLIREQIPDKFGDSSPPNLTSENTTSARSDRPVAATCTRRR